jgi:hypothetical protein
MREQRRRGAIAAMPDDIHPAIEPRGAAKSFRCPCCKYKTLRGRGHFELCPVC